MVDKIYKSILYHYIGELHMTMVKTTLSFSKEDKDKLWAIAKANKRTISAQVSWWIALDTTEID